jgi:outer membrane protein TolC
MQKRMTGTRRDRTRPCRWLGICTAAILAIALPMQAQQAPPQPSPGQPSPAMTQTQPVTSATLSKPQVDTPPVSITLAEAQARALKIEPTLLAARAAYQKAKYDRTIARSAILPQVDVVGQYLFTQSNG